MKVKNENDTTGKNAFKKVSLIDNFSINGNYNMAADSMRWSNFSTSLRLKLTKTYSLSLSAAFDPYMYALNSSGNPVRVNKLRWENGGLPRFLGTSTSYSYTLNNETFNKLFGKKDENKKDPSATNDATAGSQANEESTDEMQTEGNVNKPNNEKIQSEDGYQKVSIPWSLSFNYSVRYANTTFNKTKMEYDMDFTHNLSINGSLTLTPNWRITANSSYEIKTKQFTYTSISVNRSLHCWNMSASIVPFGVYKSYNFHLGVNASMLSDLKYDKQSEYGVNNITWY
jgi:hypothetical protein